MGLVRREFGDVAFRKLLSAALLAIVVWLVAFVKGRDGAGADTDLNAHLDVYFGVDSCTTWHPQDLSAWWSGSALYSVGVYLGGATGAPCALPANDPSVATLSQISAQGWGIALLWDDLQACGYANPISSDPSTAFTQGVASADAAVLTAIADGLATDQRTVIYLDIEHYSLQGTYDNGAPCAPSVNHYIKGWDTELAFHAHQLSGLYANPDAIVNLVNGACGGDAAGRGGDCPDGVWIADASSYVNPSTNMPEVPTDFQTVWDPSSLSNNYYWHYLRLRQIWIPPDTNPGIVFTYNNVPHNVDIDCNLGLIAGGTNWIGITSDWPPSTHPSCPGPLPSGW